MFEAGSFVVQDNMPIQVVYGRLLEAFVDTDNLHLWQQDLQTPHTPQQTHYHSFVRSMLEQAKQADWRTVSWAKEVKDDPNKHPYVTIEQALDPQHIQDLIKQASVLACARERQRVVKEWFAQRLNLASAPSQTTPVYSN